MEKYFFYFYFLIAHTSTINVLDGLKFWVHISNISFEGTVSQILVLGLIFYFMQKNGYLSIHFFEYYFQNFIENEPRPTSKI